MQAGARAEKTRHLIDTGKEDVQNPRIIRGVGAWMSQERESLGWNECSSRAVHETQAEIMLL